MCALGMHYIEGGWPGSNPKDVEFFERAKAELPDEAWAKVVAFGRWVTIRAINWLTVMSSNTVVIWSPYFLVLYIYTMLVVLLFAMHGAPECCVSGTSGQHLTVNDAQLNSITTFSCPGLIPMQTLILYARIKFCFS